MKTAFYIYGDRPDGKIFYVSAPTGYFRKRDGSIKRDSRLSAARTLAKCAGGSIREY